MIIYYFSHEKYYIKITGPLWRLLEQNKHVLDMNAHYETLLNFLDSNSKDANSFINCETFPFDQTLVHKDKFYECLKVLL
jgi:hypothetical protein